MFFGREQELNQLNAAYEQDDFQMAILYGRRRVGKTSLISEFIADKSNIFFSAQDSSTHHNLALFTREVLDHFGMQSNLTFTDWKGLFEFIASQVRQERLIIVIDELPYIAQKDPSILSALQHTIDHIYLRTKLFIILCGSTVSFMEHEVLGTKSPIFGRRTMQIRLKELPYYYIHRFLPDASASDLITLYGITGGIPLYMSLLKPGLSVKDNIYRCFLSPSAYLYDEPALLLKQELREPAVYNAILTAVAQGATRRNDIATKTGESSDKTGKYLSVLMGLGIIARQIPIGEKASARNSLYSLKDPLFRFWYRFVFPNRGLIELGHQDLVWEKRINPELATYTGQIFELVCSQYLQIANGSDLVHQQVFTEFGKWWGNNPAKKEQAEIDIVALGPDGDLFAECKWTSEPFPYSEYIELKERSSLVRQQQQHNLFVLFGKTGFDSRILAMDAVKDVLLILPKQLFQLKQLSVE